MKPHYFDQEAADADDAQLGMAKVQGYVPKTCLLGGAVVMGEVSAGRNPCRGCEGPRERCGGKPKIEMKPDPLGHRFALPADEALVQSSLHIGKSEMLQQLYPQATATPKDSSANG